MSSSHVDRNLLFGFLALQTNFITHEDLIAAVSIWLTDKSRPLEEILAQRRTLADDERLLLEALVRKHLEKHGNDAERSLAALSSMESVRDELKKLGDADVEASLAHVKTQRPAEPADPYATLPVDPALVERPRFRILRPHAAGGLGQVYVARDDELNREVALKEIKFDHANDTSSRNRFLLEAEITGGLEHPGIVPVYGLGQYADGRPYYAMRFIRGDSLKEAIARFHSRGAGVPPAQKSPLPLGQGTDRMSAGEGLHSSRSAPSFDSLAFRQLLGRFIDVCNAIEYAHSRGVLHRDLKPGNIMLGKYGETLVVDWGLAKPKGKADQHEQSDENTLRPRSASGTAATQLGAAIGTPAYMSPEQAAGRLDQLGPASDVYSLGATLYTVLTGQIPFAKSDTGDILRRVQAGEFTPPRQLSPTIPRPLEAICLKAMALRPADRYPSPQALADDIEKFLADEPVACFRESLPMKIGRWGRKHRSLVATAASVCLAATIGLIVTLLLVNAEKNRTRLREEEVRSVLAFMEERVFAPARVENRGGQMTLARALETALPLADKRFSNQPLIEAGLRRSLGTGFVYIDHLKLAEEQFQAALVLYERHASQNSLNTLICKGNLAILQSSDEKALRLAEETILKLNEILGPSHPHTLEMKNNCAIRYHAFGKHDKALEMHQETFKQIEKKLGPDDPETLNSLFNVAGSYAMQGNYADAGVLFEKVLARQMVVRGASHPETLRTMYNLTIAYTELERHAEALEWNEKLFAFRKREFGLNDPHTLMSMWAIAESLYNVNRGSDAIPIIDDCVQQARFNDLAHPRLIPDLMEIRLRHFADAGSGDGCRTTAEMWEKLERKDDVSFYTAARMRAMTAALLSRDPRKFVAAEANSLQAMSWLTRAIQAGYKDIANLKREPYLEVLRDRPDFQALLAAHEASPSTL